MLEQVKPALLYDPIELSTVAVPVNNRTFLVLADFGKIYGRGCPLDLSVFVQFIGSMKAEVIWSTSPVEQ